MGVVLIAMRQIIRSFENSLGVWECCIIVKGLRSTGLKVRMGIKNCAFCSNIQKSLVFIKVRGFTASPSCGASFETHVLSYFKLTILMDFVLMLL
jgi:hypothetical protein